MSIIKYLLFPLRKCRSLFIRIPALLKISNIPIDSVIMYPFRINGSNNIHIGHGVTINKYSWLFALPETGSKNVELTIDDGTRISYYLHIIATRRIVIGKNVNIANGVYISDNAHSYEDIDMPPKMQPLKQLNDVIIGDDTWIGERASIVGAKVGKHCVIGINTFVNKDIPDYCVVVGAPAHIVKRYNFESQQWQKTDKDGNFI